MTSNAAQRRYWTFCEAAHENNSGGKQMAEEILAPLAGKIIQLDLEVGKHVEEDEEVLVIEAMKMETPVFAPCSGTVAEIQVQEGDEVEEDDVLAVIDE
jgi:acetyl-CoA carboxylase biotin carboxyl carrier protein